MTRKEEKDHEIMLIAGDMQEDPLLMESTKLLFDWANRMGRQGIEATNLKFSRQPVEGKFIVSCDIKKGEA